MSKVPLAKPASEGESKLKFHMGEALRRLAGNYPTLLLVILEAIQNAIDSEASKIWITIDQKNRTVEIFDNGEGVTKSRFEHALTSIGKTIKRGDRLGRFGLGLISPIGKCDYFFFTSIAASGGPFREWRFDTEGLRNQQEISGIPLNVRNDLRFSRAKCGRIGSHVYVPWRTRVYMENYSTDKIISKIDLEEFREEIVNKYGIVMLKKDIVVELSLVPLEGERIDTRIAAAPFAGKPLGIVELSNPDAGATRFELYLSQRTVTGRKGKVFFGELGDDHRLTYQQFSRTAEGILSSDVADALKSGIFEGNILSEKVELLPTRRGFAKNDALVGLCLAIEEWYETIGCQDLEKAQEELQEKRWQMLGLRSMRAIAELLRLPDFHHLLDLFKRGHIGNGHADPAHPIEETDERSIAVQGGGGKPKPRVDGSEARPRVSDEELEGHRPATVIGRAGRKRIVVREGSLGLQFAYSELAGSSEVYEFDLKHGILYFNIRHPLFVKCDVNDTSLMRFQEAVAMNALTIASIPEDWDIEPIKVAFHEKLKMESEMIFNAGSSRRGKVKTFEGSKSD